MKGEMDILVKCLLLACKLWGNFITVRNGCQEGHGLSALKVYKK